MSNKDTNESQHDKLRKRLEDELSILKSSSENSDYDWLLRGQILKCADSPTVNSTDNKSTPILTPISPLKSPSIVKSNNSKATPTISTSPINSSTNKKDEDFLVSLSRSKTADAKLISSISRTSSNSSGLHRTATNIETSDIGRSRNPHKQYTSSNSNNNYSTPLQAPTQQKKKGFFKKLFGSKSDDKKAEMDIYKTNSIPSRPLSRSTSHIEHDNTSKEQSSTNIKSSFESAVSGIDSGSYSRSHSRSNSRSRSNSITKSTPTTLTASTSINKTMSNIENSLPEIDASNKKSLADQYKDIDSELSNYLNEIESSNAVKKNENDSSEYNFIFSPAGIDSISYKDDEIPAHPDKPKLPSAFSKSPRFGGSVEKELFLKQKKERAEKESSMFGSLLHKSKTNTPESYLYSGMINESEDTPPFSFEPLKYDHPPPKIEKRPPLKVLSNLKQMKKVAFATTTFVTDPPQQIPSRNPRKGNVEICANGELIIHKIDPQEKLNAATGIVVGGSGHLKLISQENYDNNDNNTTANNDNIQIDVPNASKMMKTSSTVSMNSQASMDQTIKNEDKILAAKKAREHHTGSENIDIQKEGLTIDKPMVKRKKQMEKPIVTLKMDELYTRCCHLREILPIPATLKQIPKGSTDPIPYLHLRNPRPSMIEILSFTDFIRIAPVICVSLDGVSLTHEMLRIILSSLLYKKYLEKLSMRNTPIDDEGWKMLSLFLSMNKALKKLDITQCPTLDVNTQRIKKKSKIATENRMICNVNDRSDRDWAIFTASLIYRGGIDELILTGCKIPDLKLFSNLLNLALVRTTKIGLAYNNLSLQHCYIIAHWLEENPNVFGIDLGYNDLSSKLKPFIDYANKIENIHVSNKLIMVSLNSCNLLDCEETNLFFNTLSKLPHLAYLDLSSNEKLFKTFLDTLSINLTLFSQLSRLNMDNNKLDAKSMVRFLETVPLFANLNYLSISGNEMNDVIADALCKAIKTSTTLYSVDFDKSAVDEKYQQRIGLLTMKNVETQLYKRQGVYKGVKTSFADLISTEDSQLLKRELGISEDTSFVTIIYKLIQSNDIDKKQMDRFIDIVKAVRSNMKTIIEDLIHSNVKDELSLQGKEMLIRLLSMNASIDKALELINNQNLNSIQNYEGSDLSKYDELIKHSFAQNQDDSLDSLVKKLKDDPFENTELLKEIILSTNDPYELITMIKHCKEHNIKLSDLFLKKYSESSYNADDTIDDQTVEDDASIDSAEIEEQPEENNNSANFKILQIYDLILKDLVNNNK